MHSDKFVALTVVYSKSVEKFIEDNKKLHPRLEDCMEGIEWRLSREPKHESCFSLRENYYLYKSEKFGNDIQLPSICVLYTVSENEIEFVDIKINN